MNWGERFRDCIAGTEGKTIAECEAELELVLSKFFGRNVLINFQDDITDEELMDTLKTFSSMVITVI